MKHMENWRMWNTSYSWVYTLHLKFVLGNSGEHRAEEELEKVEYYLERLHLKFVLGNSGEHRELENVHY